MDKTKILVVYTIIVLIWIIINSINNNNDLNLA